MDSIVLGPEFTRTVAVYKYMTPPESIAGFTKRVEELERGRPRRLCSPSLVDGAVRLLHGAGLLEAQASVISGCADATCSQRVSA